MFAAYLAFRPIAPVPQPAARPAPRPAQARPEPEDEEITTIQNLEQRREAPVMPGSTTIAPAAPAAPPAFGGMPMSMPMPALGRGAPSRAKSAGLLGAVSSAFAGSAEMMDEGAVMEEIEPELVAGAQWNDLDALVLAGPQEPRRGKLVPQAAAGEQSLERMAHALDGLARERWIDPGESRGMFDHRYEAGGRADVPSDGRVHRVGVATSPCNVLISWRTVPSEAPEVYREANVINPFDQALLGGPVDVYLDGSLLAQTKIERIDRGGTLWCGMGVDDRVKVARNVRVEEESAGLLGGSLAVTHTVGIELSTVIKDPIKVVVLERIPVTDDKNVEVKIVKATPVPTVYDQSERGAPVRGGCRFEVTVTPGKKLPLEIVYRLVFSSKLDIVGGSRRG
jgi:hypothetical protein